MHKLTLAIVFFFIATSGYAQSFEKGKTAYEKGDFTEAVAHFKPLAEQGLGDAQAALAVMYSAGQGLPNDLGVAAQWYLKAATQGVPSAQYDLGLCYYLGTGVPKNLRKTLRWWQEAARNGVGAAAFNLGMLSYHGYGVEQDFTKARKLFHTAARNGHAPSQYGLGVAYAFGHGGVQDYGKAKIWFRLAAKQGIPQAQFNLGILTQNSAGLEGPQDTEDKNQGQNRLKALPALKEPEQKLHPSAKKLAPKSVRSKVNQEAWILARNPASFTVQLASVLEERPIVELVRQLAEQAPTSYFHIIRQGQTWYVALLGDFRAASEAQAALDKLAPELQEAKPLIHQYKTIQAMIKGPST